jgi:hypothetical protein
MRQPEDEETESAVLDVGDALDLIADVLAHRGPASGRTSAIRGSILTECLQRAGLDQETAERLQLRPLRERYALHLLPLQLTLGAAIAFDMVQRSERLGLTGSEGLANAIRVASRIPDLISDRTWQTQFAHQVPASRSGLV